MKFAIKKHFTKGLSLVMVLILLTCSLSACGDAKDGNKETTPSVNVVSNPEVDESGDNEEEIQELTPEEEKLIREIYSKTYGHSTSKVEKIYLKDVRNGAYAVLVKTFWDRGEKFNCEVVNGLDFVYDSTRPLHIVYEGECYRLSDAYEKGIVDDDWLYTLFQKCKAAKSTTTIDDEFKDNVVVAMVMPSYNMYEYTPDDFPEIDCIAVEDWWKITVDEKDTLCRIISIVIDGHDKQKIVDAVKILEGRVDFYHVGPTGYMEQDATSNDCEYIDGNQ